MTHEIPEEGLDPSLFAPDAPVAKPEGATETPNCPLSLELLAPGSRKFFDEGAALKMRTMAARAVIPMPPTELLLVLYFLSFDPEASVRDTARGAVSGLDERILTPGLRGSLPPEVLDFLADTLIGNLQGLQLLLLNSKLPDDAVARLAMVVDGELLDIIGQNQLRIIRHPGIIEGLTKNPNASAALLDGVFDFAVRSGLNLPDLPAFQEARVRLLGEEAVRALDDEPDPNTAEKLISENRELLLDEADGKQQQERDPEKKEDVEKKQKTITQQILTMTVSEKVKLGMLGNKEARTILMRDPNKLVQEAVVHSPRITEGELIGLTNSRTIPDTILRYILLQRDIMRVYQVKVNLVNNPKLPLATALKMLPLLRPADLRGLSKNKNVARTLATQAKNLLARKSGASSSE